MLCQRYLQKSYLVDYGTARWRQGGYALLRVNPFILDRSLSDENLATNIWAFFLLCMYISIYIFRCTYCAQRMLVQCILIAIRGEGSFTNYVYKTRQLGRWSKNVQILSMFIQLNKYETDPYFLQIFQRNTTVCLIIYLFCKSCEPELEIVFVLNFVTKSISFQ